MHNDSLSRPAITSVYTSAAGAASRTNGQDDRSEGYRTTNATQRNAAQTDQTVHQARSRTQLNPRAKGSLNIEGLWRQWAQSAAGTHGHDMTTDVAALLLQCYCTARELGSTRGPDTTRRALMVCGHRRHPRCYNISATVLTITTSRWGSYGE